jgi:Fic family protein
MIPYEEIELTPETKEQLSSFATDVEGFRVEGPLDKVSLAKLEEHFRASHVYHSAGIEGNRLTLQETALVLKEGLDISGKPVKDSMEVKHLGEAFDYLYTLAAQSHTIREADIRSLHSLLIGNDPGLDPGEYRKVGVIISGSEHRPPEPLEVPGRMETLVSWLNLNLDKDPILASSIAHHELAAIHPFKDGNGRVSRLLMNLVLLRRGYPISNIRREDRPGYYDALSFADVGLYDPLVRTIYSRSAELFKEYLRIRTETKRTAEWAAKWGLKEGEILRKRESRELELWQSRIRQVFLEFQKAAELLDDKLGQISLSFYDYKGEITFERYQQLLEEGQTDHANAFSITFRNEQTGDQERFMFRYYRNFKYFPAGLRVIPLELNYFDKTQNKYIRISDLTWRERVRVQAFYFTPEGEITMRYFNLEKHQDAERKSVRIPEIVEWFYDDVLSNVLHLKP